MKSCEGGFNPLTHDRPNRPATQIAGYGRGVNPSGYGDSPNGVRRESLFAHDVRTLIAPNLSGLKVWGEVVTREWPPLPFFRNDRDIRG